MGRPPAKVIDDTDRGAHGGRREVLCLELKIYWLGALADDHAVARVISSSEVDLERGGGHCEFVMQDVFFMIDYIPPQARGADTTRDIGSCKWDTIFDHKPVREREEDAHRSSIDTSLHLKNAKRSGSQFHRFQERGCQFVFRMSNSVLLCSARKQTHFYYIGWGMNHDLRNPCVDISAEDEVERW